MSIGQAKRNVVVAMTGASGAAYGMRLVEALVATGADVQLTISPAAADVIRQELDLAVDLERFHVGQLMLDIGPAPDDLKLQQLRTLSDVGSESSNVLSFSTGEPGHIQFRRYDDLMAPIASGSYPTDGMVVCPCSGGTLSAVVHGTSRNLIHRAAEVHLKERRTLVLVPRETPLSQIQLENMLRAARIGAVILPAAPGFYHGVKSIGDLVDFVVARVLDQLGIANNLIEPWGTA